MMGPLDFLNRFTTIPFLIDLIVEKRLTLLNPDKWEDYNDRVTMDLYKAKKEAKSIYALCLTRKRETIHHWSAFAPGTSGCCIEFDYLKLVNDIRSFPGLSHAITRYVKLNDLKYLPDDIEILPYLKRQAFEPEQEYRLVVVSNKPQEASIDIPISLKTINRITFTNKLPESVVDNLKKAISLIAPEYKGKLVRSTLFNNSKWSNHFSKQNGS
jgi:hypothetical protein